MSEKSKTVALAVGAALATSLAGVSVASADTSPFAMTTLSSGYMADVQYGEGKCGGEKGDEGKCGGEKGDEGKCGEGKCGGEKGEEGKCGEGKCGGSV